MKIFKGLAVASAMMAGTAGLAQEQFITIGTGGQTGVYFVVVSPFVVWLTAEQRITT